MGRSIRKRRKKNVCKKAMQANAVVQKKVNEASKKDKKIEAVEHLLIPTQIFGNGSIEIGTFNNDFPSRRQNAKPFCQHL